MNELKPCPFCGGVGYPIDCSITRDPWWVVTCRDCGAHGLKRSSKRLAIADWNTRYERTCKCDDDGRCECGTLVRWKDNCEPYETVDGLIAYKSIHPPVTRYYEYCPICGAKVVGE